ncbi:CU044_5270 family protein [Streptomyces sp. NPDC059893]|uniref:CU044_5270 family protein n=1 Tax=Streptomyces sp. NPDC059893 TaxID=3346990 RepID=UPI00364E7FAD
MSTQQHDDVLDFPGAADLVAAGRTPEPDAAVLAAALSAVRGAIDAETGKATAPAAAEPRVVIPLYRRRRVLASAVAVAAVAAAAIIAPVVSVDGGEPAAGAEAAAFFNSMAKKAASSADGPFWKITSTTSAPGTATKTRTVFLSPDGLTAVENGETLSKPQPNGMSWPVGNKRVGWNGLKNLPTDPSALRAKLAAGKTGAAADEQVVTEAGQLLSFSPARAELRAALYRVMAATPGADIRTEVSDAKGRKGTEVNWKYVGADGPGIAGDPHWIIDPATGGILEESRTAAEDYDGSGCEPSDGVDKECTPSLSEGDLTSRQTFLFNGPVNRIS